MRNTKRASLLSLSWLAFGALVLFGLCAPQAAAESRLVAQATGAKKTVTTNAKGDQVVTIKQANRTKYLKVTKHTFRGGQIGGKKHGPNGRSVVLRANRTFKSMIRLRANFNMEMWKGAKSL